MNFIAPIIGHEATQAQLVELMAKQKLPHAILLTGPRGIGKAALAEGLLRCLLTDSAQASLAEKKLGYDAENAAISRLESGGHGNILRVEPLADDKKGKMSYTTISITQVREVVEFMHLSTSEKGWRIVLIDPADGLNTNAENALLKVLEEPPKQTILILITHQPDKLLPTTRSRCREIKLTPPTTAQVSEILQQQGVNLTADEESWLSILAPASAGQWQRYIEYEADGIYADWLAAFGAPKTDKVQALATKLAKFDAKGWAVASELLLVLLHRLQLLANAPSLFQPISAQEQQQMQQLLAQHPANHWQEMWDKATYWLPQTVQSNYDKKQVVQSLLYQAAAASKNAA